MRITRQIPASPGPSAVGTAKDTRLNKRGFALVLTLSVLALMTALTVEFIDSVRLNATFMENWETTRELSLAARSGASIAVELLFKELANRTYSYPGRIDIPPLYPFADGKVQVAVSIEDEDSKFNIAKLVTEGGARNDAAYAAFLRLLGALDISPSVADRIAGWMSGGPGGRRGPLRSVDEILEIPGVDRSVYDKLKPYVTVFGSGLININGAAAPVLRSLDGGISPDMAGRIVSRRDEQPFESAADITKVAGFEGLGIGLMGRICVKGTAYYLTVQAASPEGVRSTIECAVGGDGKVQYWREL